MGAALSAFSGIYTLSKVRPKNIHNSSATGSLWKTQYSVTANDFVNRSVVGCPARGGRVRQRLPVVEPGAGPLKVLPSSTCAGVPVKAIGGAAKMLLRPHKTHRSGEATLRRTARSWKASLFPRKGGFA